MSDRVYRQLAERLRQLTTEGDAAQLLRFKVTAPDPLTLAQIEGELVLTEGDPDFEIGDWLSQFRSSWGLAPDDVVWVIDAGGEYQAFDVLSSIAPEPSLVARRVFVGPDEPTYTDGYYLWAHVDGDDVYLMAETEGTSEGDGSGRFFVGPREPGQTPPWAWVPTDGTDPLGIVFDASGAFVDITRRFFVGPTQPTDADYPCIWIQTGFGDPDGFTLWLIEDV